MKKILFLGNNCHVDELILLAKKNGLYTIVTDNLSEKESPVKSLADESWNISVTDLDMLEELGRKNNINAVMCGASEICLSANRDYTMYHKVTYI